MVKCIYEYFTLNNIWRFGVNDRNKMLRRKNRRIIINDRLPGAEPRTIKCYSVFRVVYKGILLEIVHTISFSRIIILLDPGVAVRLIYYYQNIITGVKKKNKIKTTQHSTHKNLFVASAAGRQTQLMEGVGQPRRGVRADSRLPSRTVDAPVSPTRHPASAR